MENDLLVGYESQTKTLLKLIRTIYLKSTTEESDSIQQEYYKNIILNIRKCNTSISYMNLELVNENEQKKKIVKKRIKKYKNEIKKIKKKVEKKILFVNNNQFSFGNGDQDIISISSPTEFIEDFHNLQSSLKDNKNDDKKLLLNEDIVAKKKISFKNSIHKIKKLINKGHNVVGSTIENIKETNEDATKAQTNINNLNTQQESNERPNNRKYLFKKWLNRILCWIIVILIIGILILCIYFFVIKPFFLDKKKKKEEP